MSKGKSEHRGVRNTKQKLHEGLLSLMRLKPIQEITVKELTELTDMNRGTFYFHYTDIYDLLREMEEAFFRDFSETLQKEPRFQPGSYPYLSAVFSFLGENRSFCQIMLGPNGDMLFVEQVKKLVDERCSHFWRAAALDADPARFEMYNAFIINGCIGLFQKWLDNPESSSPEDIAELAATIILSSVQSAIT